MCGWRNKSVIVDLAYCSRHTRKAPPEPGGAKPPNYRTTYVQGKMILCGFDIVTYSRTATKRRMCRHLRIDLSAFPATSSTKGPHEMRHSAIITIRDNNSPVLPHVGESCCIENDDGIDRTRHTAIRLTRTRMQTRRSRVFPRGGHDVLAIGYKLWTQCRT